MTRGTGLLSKGYPQSRVSLGLLLNLEWLEVILYAARYAVEGKRFALEKQADELLVLVGTIEVGMCFLSSCVGRLTGRILDGSVGNLSVPPDGTLYAAGEHSRVDGISALTLISVLPKVFQFVGPLV